MITPSIKKANCIIGNRLVLRDVNEGDADFILKLRTGSDRKRYISPTSSQLSDQVEWLRRYRLDPSQAYFMVERADGVQIGTIRMYDARGTSFCWGSWIFRPGEPFYHSIESAMMIYSYGFWCGFKSSHFEVDRRNMSVCRFHESFGARCVGEKDGQFVYSIESDQIQQGLERYRRFLPDGISVTNSRDGGNESH